MDRGATSECRPRTHAGQSGSGRGGRGGRGKTGVRKRRAGRAGRRYTRGMPTPTTPACTARSGARCPLRRRVLRRRDLHARVLPPRCAARRGPRRALPLLRERRGGRAARLPPLPALPPRARAGRRPRRGRARRARPGRGGGRASTPCGGLAPRRRARIAAGALDGGGSPRSPRSSGRRPPPAPAVERELGASPWRSPRRGGCSREAAARRDRAAGDARRAGERLRQRAPLQRAVPRALPARAGRASATRPTRRRRAAPASGPTS
jgi:hypothetical protein